MANDSINNNDDFSMSSNEDANLSEEINSFTPQNLNDASTFEKRNDPKEILFRYRLQLMNAYLVEEEVKDEITGVVKIRKKIKYKKNTKPKANKQGIEDILSYVEKFINSHVVQGNIESLEEYRNKMKSFSDDITIHFMAKRRDWDVDIRDIDMIVSNAINLIDLFITRLLYNEERKSYGESYKEQVTREDKAENKTNMFQTLGGLFRGRN